MWQRIQTLYLAISTLLIGLMFFSDKAVRYGADGAIQEAIGYTAYVPYLILLVVIFLLNVLALTSYKFRVFQMRTAGLSALITIALQVWLIVDFALTHSDYVFRISVIFPLVTVILDMLAYKHIFADELLVETSYHLRESRKKRNKKRRK